jgi:membrane protein YdbS with pleckstrin-like domain
LNPQAECAIKLLIRQAICFYSKENKMKLTPPTQLTFWISVILGLLGLIGTFVSIPFVSAYAFWFVVVGFALLVAGLLFKGL